MPNKADPEKKTLASEAHSGFSKRKKKKDRTRETMETQDAGSEAALPSYEKMVKDQLKAFANRLLKVPILPDKTIAETNITLTEVTELTYRARERLMGEPGFVRVAPGICVFGDIHGQYQDFIKMLEKTGVPPKQRMLFLGDYVDRGPYSLETVCLLLTYKVLYPKHIYLLRGNHETRAVNTQYGFIEECRTRYGTENGNATYTNMMHVFNCMPVAALIANRIFCCHGGISEYLHSFNQFKNIIRPCDITDTGMLCDLIWSDPNACGKGYEQSPRSISQTFGADAAAEFCDTLNIDLVIRAHQCVNDGVEFLLNDRLITVFSAPFYCNETDNLAGMVCVDKNLNIQGYQSKSILREYPPKQSEKEKDKEKEVVKDKESPKESNASDPK
ncbi:unnamed protein product [Bursaphelenchus okinawaensis]|uniref:Serine/threonine-protein phosphatase n=1 Tax=Bursaphelenchus okinawaensis TaxID=465554 RepID=A0A811KU01_9BILA|nr:unnamed protein product [Bursaphelenchus okinawaensis]CAG9113204.1 unnamed protein product [Bursaphelenchus okinawaensis]